MNDVMVKLTGFVLMIFLGFAFRRMGIFKKEHGVFLGKVILNITIPCAVISSSQGITFSPILLLCTLLGLLGNVILILVTLRMGRKRNVRKKTVVMLNSAGYNVGSFGLPYIQSFLGPLAVPYVFMFDVGNAIMCLGVNYTIACGVLAAGGENRKKMSAGQLLKKLFTTIPLDVYLIIFILSILHITIPNSVVTITSIAGNANGFLSMLMIGIILELHLPKEAVKDVVKILVTRLVFALGFSILVYFFFPADYYIRMIVILCLFAPIIVAASVYEKELVPESDVSGVSISISIIMALVLMTVIQVIFL